MLYTYGTPQPCFHCLISHTIQKLLHWTTSFRVQTRNKGFLLLTTPACRTQPAGWGNTVRTGLHHITRAGLCAGSMHRNPAPPSPPESHTDRNAPQGLLTRTGPWPQKITVSHLPQEGGTAWGSPQAFCPGGRAGCDKAQRAGLLHQADAFTYSWDPSLNSRGPWFAHLKNKEPSHHPSRLLSGSKSRICTKMFCKLSSVVQITDYFHISVKADRG